MERDDHSETIATFCSITGCSAHVAEHYLSAYNFDLDRSVDFFYQNPPDASGAGAGGNAGHGDNRPVTIDDDFEDMPPMRARSDSPPPAARPQPPLEPSLDEDEELQRALAASMTEGARGNRRAEPTARPTHIRFPDDDEDEAGGGEDEALQALARQRAAAVAAARRHEEMVEEMMHAPGIMGGAPTMFPGFGAMPHVAPGPGYPMPRAPPYSPPHHGGDDDDDMQDLQGGPGGMWASHAGRSQGAGSSRPADLPEGVDEREYEEARMLEAALLGVPYEGRIPDFSREASRPRNLDPAYAHQRNLREEQDLAFEESLAADRAKAESLAAAAMQAEERERAEREAAEAEARRVAEAAAAEARRVAEEERRVQDSLASKRRALPEEPGPSEPDSLSIMVRLPDGSRLGRRFRRSDLLQSVFDYIDVQHNASSFKPHTYNLVNSYPRKVFSEGMPGRLEEVGITADTALFLEPRA